MNESELLNRTERAFARVFATQCDFSPELDRVAEPRWTSLKHVEFIVALEKEFDVRFDGADATDMSSIPLVLERIRQRLL